MRLFVAFDLRPEVREAISHAIAHLKPLCAAARFVRPEGMHLTLKFIGHIEDDAGMKTLAAIRAALAAVRSASPVNIHFRGAGYFPNARYPRVIWCGVEVSENLAPLAGDISRAIEPMGIAAETREFVPHLTLARFHAGKQAGEGLKALIAATKQLKTRDFGSASEAEFHLFESRLKPTGAEYAKIETYSFVKAAA